VGHEPLLSTLATDLLGDAAWTGAGADGEARSRLKKSGVLSLRWDGRGPASLRFLLDPKEMSLVTQSGPAGAAEASG
jgi:phosphohistidine phosphatase